MNKAQSEAVTNIEPPGWTSLDLKELWQYRDLIWFLTARDIKAKYRQMAFGVLWIILKPVASMVVFSVVFGALAAMPSDELPYPLFAYAGLLPWNYFSSAVNSSSGGLINYMSIISKIYFPRLVIPFAAVLSGLADLLIASSVLVLMMLHYGIAPTVNIVALPFYVAFAAMTALALGLWTAALAVRYRDLIIIVSYGLQFALYVTPVAYASSAIPEQWQTLYRLNPMYWVVEGFRWALLGVGNGPESFMLIPLGIVAALLVSGMFIFRRTELTVVDWL